MRAAQDAQQRQPPIAATPNQPPEANPEADTPSPLVAGLCVLAAVAVGFVVYFATQKS